MQHWLGHHSAAFTLARYIHLLDQDDLGGALEPVRGKEKARSRPETTASREPPESAEMPGLQA